MTSHAQIETSKSITRQAVSSALQDNGFRAIVLHDVLDNRFKNGFVRGVVDAITKGEVDSVVFSRPDTHISKLASAWKVFAVFVERYRHHTVRGVKSFFNTVSVVNVDVNVQNALFVAKEFQYAQDDV